MPLVSAALYCAAWQLTGFAGEAVEVVLIGCQTHADWNRHDMTIYRDDLRKLAKRYDIVLGPQPAIRKSGC